MTTAPDIRSHQRRTRRPMASVAAAGVLALLLSACGSQTEPPADPGAGGQVVLPTGPVSQDIVDRPSVQAAVTDLAERESVPADEVAVAGYEKVTWSDGSLGCPEPGEANTAALVDGEQLVLRVGEQLFSYHAARDWEFFYCASPVAPVPSQST